MTRLVRGVPKHYAWGDREAIPRLLGEKPNGMPVAELWFGTHPNGPSTVVDPDSAAWAGEVTEQPLAEVSGTLPYLLKLLAAAEPLSLQTHPTGAQAAAGFAREEADGVTGDERIYVDTSSKPELICALTPFDALCGFAPIGQSAALLRAVGDTGGRLADRLITDGIESVVTHLMIDQPPLDDLLAGCRALRTPTANLAADLARRYPGDPAVAVTLLMNHLTLNPGQAMFLAAGNLHAYLRGTGVEVMSASDNVIRGGLTRKHVDVIELLRTVDFRPLANPVARPDRAGPHRVRFPTPGAPFTLYGVHVVDRAEIQATARDLVLCGAGSTDELRTGQVAYLAPGEELIVEGTATLFHVTELNGPPPAGCPL